VQAPALQVPGETKECRVVAVLHTGAGGTSQAAQATPLRPQRVALWVPGLTQVPELLQQPSGQLVASHTQAPLEQRWPAPHSALPPQAHWPLALQLSAPTPQAWHARPRGPQAVTVRAVQREPTQQPAPHVAAQPEQVPLTQVSPI
jgi:hypothetical protein